MNPAAERQLTLQQRVLLAAYRLENAGHSPFSAEALIVTSWQDSPQAFGLKGFTDQYPDSNRVLACIMGEKGLAGRGWLTKKGQKLYCLSKLGKLEAARLQEGDKEGPPAKEKKVAKPNRSRVPPELERDFLNLSNATAVQRYREGLRRELTYRDACHFWGITENMRGDAVTQRIDRVPQIMGEVEALLIDDAVELSNGRSVSGDELQQILAVHGYLKEQFSRHLSLQRLRGGRD